MMFCPGMPWAASAHICTTPQPNLNPVCVTSTLLRQPLQEMCCLTLQVLAKEPRPGEPGDALLAEVLELVSINPDNQALTCLQARQLMQLDRMADTLQTVSGFVGVGNAVAPSRWALHVTVHVRWLIGGLDQVWLRPHPLPLCVTLHL